MLKICAYLFWMMLVYILLFYSYVSFLVFCFWYLLGGTIMWASFYLCKVLIRYVQNRRNF
jgi:hypothetical protein